MHSQNQIQAKILVYLRLIFGDGPIGMSISKDHSPMI
jgi:hypothetical protein